MAPFDGRHSPDLINKVSTQIDGQLPDFVADDHPIFSSFLQSYYKYLESGELQVSATIDNLLIEVDTPTLVLDEESNPIVLESGTGTTGKFIVGETITGGTSKATAEVLVDDLGNATTPRLFITSQQQFVTGETITGGTSSATGTVTRYRASPVQNIQQLLAYADVDNTIFDFIEEFRKTFMSAIPSSLATGLDKRNLTKNIKELYRRKGTQEGAKLFLRILLDEDAEIFYPNTRMLRVSGGDWDKPTVMRVSPIGSPVTSETVGQKITGQTSGATAFVQGTSQFVDPSDQSTIQELELNQIDGTFEKDEIISVISSVQDVEFTYTVRQIVSSMSITKGGILYSVADTIDVDTSQSIGSGDVEVKVDKVGRGSVSGVAVDDGGTNYEIGDVLTFTDNSNEAGLVDAATGFVSVVHGSIITEDNDTLVQEEGTNKEVELFSLVQEDGGELFFESGNAASYTDGINTEAVLGNRIQCESSLNLTRVDTTRRDNDTFVLESGNGDITKVFLQDGGIGYSKLPTVTVTSKFGTGTKLLATTQTIGAVEEVNISNFGMDYSEAPTSEFRANFVIKDITGTFSSDIPLTSHDGTVRAFESGTQILQVSIEDKVGVTSEGSTEENIRLEDSLVDTSFVGSSIILDGDVSYDDNLVDADGNNIVLDAFDAMTDYITLEDGTGPAGELIMEFAEVRGSQILLESGDGTFGGIGPSGSILTEDGDYVVNEDEETELPFEYNTRYIKFVQESSDPSITFGAGDNLVINDLVTDENLVTNDDKKIILNGTDTSGTDNGAEPIITFEDNSGNPLFAVEDFDEIVFDGTNSSGLDANDNVILNEDIDFTNTTITTATASGTIVNSNIAKGNLNLGLTADKLGSYGVGIESLIGEDLIRIQDSFYYQQFSYEVQTASGAGSYIDQLKKAVHPSGFAVFSKVKSATRIYAGVSTPTGASLGDEYVADTNTFSPILASTFETLFDEVKQTRHRAFGFAAEHVELETETGVGVIRTENELDAVKLSLEDGTLTGEYDRRVVRTIVTKVETQRHTPTADSTNGATFISNVTQESVVGDTIAREVGEELGAQGFAGDLLLNNTSDSLTDENAGERILLESTTDDINIGQGTAFRAFTTFKNDTVVQEDGDNLLLETGFNLKIEDEVAGVPTIGELSVSDGLNISDDNSVVNILVEESDTGSIMQEDETTVATTHGDEFLLEDATGIMRGGKLSIETQTIALESETSVGHTPSENFSGSTRVPKFNRSAEIYVRPIGQLMYEDAIDDGQTNIVYEANTTDLSGANIADENVQLENGTPESFLSSIYSTGLFQGFDATAEGFDTTEHTFDMTLPQ